MHRQRRIMYYVRGAARHSDRLVVRKMIERRQQKSSDTNFLAVTLVLERYRVPYNE
jgi:hypothetical protein